MYGQRTPGPLLRASRPFTAGEQPDSASSQCQTATQQAIPSDQPAANLYLSDEIDPMRLDGLRRNLFLGSQNVSALSQAAARIVTITEPGFRHSRFPFRKNQWWSQTGSNRRHRACKARALPAELWPPLGKDHLRSFASKPSAFRQIVQKPGVWWAWEDLNFRPHAYQARALTN